jgi:hypothetical protein
VSTGVGVDHVLASVDSVYMRRLVDASLYATA